MVLHSFRLDTRSEVHEPKIKLETIFDNNINILHIFMETKILDFSARMIHTQSKIRSNIRFTTNNSKKNILEST